MGITKNGTLKPSDFRSSETPNFTNTFDNDDSSKVESPKVILRPVSLSFISYPQNVVKCTETIYEVA